MVTLRQGSPPTQRGDAFTQLMHAEWFAQNGHRIQACALYRTAAASAEAGGDLGQALSIWSRVVDLDGSYDARVRVAELLRELGRHREAAGALDALADEALRRTWTQAALDACKAAVDAEALPARRRRLAHLYLQTGMQVEALVQLDLAADDLLRARQLDMVVELSRRMLALAPHHLPALRRMAKARLERGEPEAAIVDIRRALGLDRRDPATLELVAEAFVALGRNDKAADVVYLLARRHQSRGDAGEARRLVARGLAWRPQSEELERLQRELATECIRLPKKPIVAREGIAALDLTAFADTAPPAETASDEVEELSPEEVALLVDDDTAARYATAGGADPQWYMETIGLG